MELNEVSLILGGAQGSGLEASMLILSRALAYGGYGVIADREYYSNITGRHSYIHMNVSATNFPRSLRYPVNLLAAMDSESIFTHFNDVANGGVIIYDRGVDGKRVSDVPSMEDVLKLRVLEHLQDLNIESDVSSILTYLEKERRITRIGVDFTRWLRMLASKFELQPRVLSRYVSGIIVATTALILGLDLEYVKYGFEVQFGSRKEIVKENLYLMDLIKEDLNQYKGLLQIKKPTINSDKVMLATGNDFVAIGKIVAGVRYQSYYPITPAADESFLLEKFEVIEYDGDVIGPIIVMQTEDEIAAITSAMGASLTGSRSSTATSGPGFDLMVEGLSWAGMNEVPIVITYYQRGGPSTGQPTRGSQSDLFNAAFSAHGEFARVVLSSGDHLEAFYDTVNAFNIAERYQVPVIHLLDKFLANSLATVPVPDLSKVTIDRGFTSNGGKDYKRFDLNHKISPRAFLGTLNTVMWYSGDEHDEYGHIVEDPENRISMYSKRIEKLQIIEYEVPEEIKLRLYGEGSPDYLIVGWGSVKGVALDALDELRKAGYRGMYLDMKMLYPFPRKEFLKAISGVDPSRVIAVEHSYNVSISDLISMSTNVKIVKKVAKFTGRPMVLNEFVEAIIKLLTSKEEYKVLRYGA